MHADFALIIGRLRLFLDWLPDWLASAIILGTVSLAAHMLHRWLLRALRRSTVTRSHYLTLLMDKSEGPTRLAFVLFFFTMTLPLVPLPSSLTHGLVSALSAIFILLIGWSGIAAVELLGDLSLDRIKTAEGAKARKHVTQIRLLNRSGKFLIGLITIAAAMMTLPAVRQNGVSLFASAGAAGLIVGLAARPVLSNLLAGIQIAITQPIRIEDSVIINNEWGWVEDITGTYVVIRTWDWRRLIVPLAWFLEQPFQNWTRESTDLLGTVLLYVDYQTPIADVRQAVERIVRQSSLWDGKVVNLQVVDATQEAIQIRILASSSDAGKAWDLRCEIREKLITVLQAQYPRSLPRQRMHFVADEPAGHRDDGEHLRRHL
ncbi:MAG: mechanosensitive ion channel [Methanobacterium sp.]|nr:mechanosensitive ion channel [Methanobacterium sp.]